MKSKKILYGLLLLIAAVVWGAAFVAQRVGMDYVGPFTFSFVRFLIGSVVLIPVCIIVVRQSRKKREVTDPKSSEKEKVLIKNTIMGGIYGGIIICMATALQQYAIQFTTAGKAGFITALYIIFVPILGIFLKKKITKLVAGSVFIAMIGLYFLCIPVGDGLTFTNADVLLLLSAILYAFHILTIAHYAPKGYPVVIASIQFLVAGVISAVPAFLLENPSWDGIYAGRISILYAGLMACGVAYTLQVVAQKHVEPTTASLILSMESVMSAVAGWLILQQFMNGREIFGAVLMFAAMILAQVPARFFRR